MKQDNYVEINTDIWHKLAPETRGYVVCSMNEATHVVFSEMDLNLAGEDADNFSKNHVYPVKRIKESGDLLIIDDKGQTVIGFDLFIPCEYLKENHEVKKNKGNKQYTSKVISLLEYKNNRK